MGLWVDSVNLMRTWVGVIAPAAFAFCGCAQNAKGRIYLIDEFRSVSGNLIVKNGFDPENAQFSLIDSNGYRTVPSEFQFNSDTKNFSFNLEDTDFYDVTVGTLIERMLSMGNTLPIVGFLDSNSFGRVERYVKFEVRPSKLQDEKIQKVPYLQFAIPLSKRNLYSGNNDLNFGSALEIGEAVFAKIKVVDFSGAPLVGADAAAVSYSKIEEGSTPYWQLENFRPVFTKTDQEGIAFVGPIVPNELQAFHLLVKGTGLCTYVSDSNFKFSSEYEVPSIAVSKCEGETSDAFSLRPSFPTGLKYFDLESDSFDDFVVHTNEPSIFVRLDSATENLRGYKVELFETDSKYVAYPEPELVREFPFFQSEVNLELPEKFKRSNDQAGKFVIKITEQQGALNGYVSSSQQPSETFIYGDKRVTNPSREDLMSIEIVEEADFVWDDSTSKPESIDYWKNVSVKSEAGVENVISGLAGRKFTISSSSCTEGSELGFEVISLGISRRFVPCINGVSTFTSESAGFINAAQTIQSTGGRQVWRLYMKDRFGNESDALSDTVDPDLRLNIMTVIIDTGAPVLGEGYYSLENLEFLKDGTPQGIIAKANVQSGDVSLRFQEALGPEKVCVQAGTDAAQDNANGKAGSTARIKNGLVDLPYYLFRDELSRIIARDENYELAGLQFVKYAIASTKEAAEAKPISEFTQCRELSDPDDITSVVAVQTVLTEDHIKFPSDTTAPAEFFLRVQDSAGNLSEVTKYEIPACTDITDPANPTPATCWAPEVPEAP